VLASLIHTKELSGLTVIFWCNEDSRLAVASVSIPYGQRFITIDMENQANILFVAPGNLWLRLTTQQQLSNDAATAGTAAAVAVESVDTWVTYTPVLATGSTIDTNQRILNMELYINNIFVNPEIK
jgi:formylmethanofuran:tetrahydromethanopterin formyltransferase